MFSILHPLTTLPLLLLLLQPANVAPQDTSPFNAKSDILSEWQSSIRVAKESENVFALTAGDSMDLDCRGMPHVSKIQVPLELNWQLLDKPLTNEGFTGRIHIKDDNGRLTIEDLNERDSGLYAVYAPVAPLASILVMPKQGNSSVDGEQPSDQSVDNKQVAICLFVVRLDKLRSFALREGEVFSMDTEPWLAPFASTLVALQMRPEHWILTWSLDNQQFATCRNISSCRLNFTASRSQTVGTWRLELRNLMDIQFSRRILLELSIKVQPPLDYLAAFPLSTHQYYMVYVTLMIGLFLLSLHLFNNLNWTPFAFDVLPDQVSPKAVLDQAGVFLKETRV